MDNDLLESHKSKLMQLAFGLGFLVLVLVAVKMLMAGNYSKIGAIIGLIGGISVVLALDRLYWLLCPTLMLLNVSIPGLPFDGPELGMIALISVHFIRAGFHKERALIWNRNLLVTLPAVLWIFLIWCMNPAGLAIFGSQVIGFRFYFKLLLGFLTLLSLSTLRISEGDCRILFRALFAVSIIAFVWSVFRPISQEELDSAILGRGMSLDELTNYRYLSAIYPVSLLFARWALPEILTSSWKFLFAISCAGFVTYSGKRQAFGFLCLLPFYRCFLTRRHLLATGTVVVLGCFFLLFVVVGDGSLYRLPRSATRVLALAFPKYRTVYTEGIRDTFRENMREEATFVIRNSPAFGRKGFAMDYSETAWIAYGGGMTSDFASHAYSGNWHSTWHGMAADFGIPLTVFWALFSLYLVWYVYQAFRTCRFGMYGYTCALWYSFLLLNSLVFSYHSGHSALTPMNTWYQYGMLLAIVGGTKGVES